MERQRTRSSPLPIVLPIINPLQTHMHTPDTPTHPPIRFPSSFADFKLPSVHPPPVPPSSNPWSYPASSTSAASNGSTTADGLEGYPLYHKRRMRRGSTLSLNNHSASAILAESRSMDGSSPTTGSFNPEGSTASSSSSTTGEPHSKPNPFRFGPTPTISSFGTPSPSANPDPNTAKWDQPQSDVRPSSAGSTAMLSPSSTKSRMRSGSPPGAPVLNPSASQASDSGSKGEATLRMVTRRGSLYVSHTFSQDKPSCSLKHLDRLSFQPKHMAHTLTAKLLSTELNPSSSEIRSEAQIQRLLASLSTTPTPFRSRSSLSGGASAEGRLKVLSGGRNRFPEDEGDLFEQNEFSGEDTSEEDDLTMEDTIDPGESFLPGRDGSAQIRSAFGHQPPTLPHQTFTFHNRAQPFPSFSSSLGVSQPIPSLQTGPFPSGLTARLSTGSAQDGETDGGMSAVSSPVMGSPRRTVGSTGNVGPRPVTPGSAGMGWREGGGRKRKACVEEVRFVSVSLCHF